jgi:CRP-like cAMP-binding protein
VIGQLLVGNVEDRVALRLAQLSKGSTAPGPVVLPITQSEIAEMCGLSRPTVQQALSGLEKRGLVRPGYRRIEIPEPDKLTLRNGAELHSLSESEAE